MPFEGCMWLGSILNNITQKYEDRRGCTEVDFEAARTGKRRMIGEVAGWRRLVCACALEGTPGSSKSLKRGRQICFKSLGSEAPEETRNRGFRR